MRHSDEKNKKRVLITAPSLDNQVNVSGISSITKLIIDNNNDVLYKHYLIGKSDRESLGFRWMIKQVLVPFAYFKFLIKEQIDIVHINMPVEPRAIIRESVILLLSKFKKKKIILHLHGGRWSNTTELPLFIILILKTCLRLSNNVLTLGVNEKKTVTSYFKIDESKVIVFQNAVQNIYRDIKNYSDTLNLLYIGRIDKNKGLLEIIESVKIFSSKYSVVLRVAGDGNDLNWFLELARKEIPNKFIYFGVVDGKEKDELFVNSDVILLPSYYEGLPLALLEGMSYGLIPIVTPVGSIPEVVFNYKNGILVQVKDSKSIAIAMFNLTNNQELFKLLKYNAMLTIREKFSINNYIERLNKIYLKN